MRDALTYVLLESPLALGVPLALLIFGLLVHWRRSGRARPLLVGLGAAATLLVIQALVVTQREIAQQALTTIQRDLERGRVDALARLLSPSFRTQTYDRAGFLELGRRRLETLRIIWAQRTGLEVIDSQPQRFTALASYLANVAVQDMRVTTRSSWLVTFVSENGRWMIAEILPRTLDGHELRTWDELGR